MNNLVAQLSLMIEPVVAAMGFELYGCEVDFNRRHSVIRVYVDGPNGVTIDDCAQVSRQISSMLDVEEPITGSYNLEVSSPGIERPLLKIDHYQGVIGETIKLRLRVPYEGKRNYVGTLLGVDGDQIVVQEGEIRLVTRIRDIDKAKLLLKL